MTEEEVTYLKFILSTARRARSRLVNQLSELEGEDEDTKLTRAELEEGVRQMDVSINRLVVEIPGEEVPK